MKKTPILLRSTRHSDVGYVLEGEFLDEQAQTLREKDGSKKQWKVNKLSSEAKMNKSLIEFPVNRRCTQILLNRKSNFWYRINFNNPVTTEISNPESLG